MRRHRLFLALVLGSLLTAAPDIRADTATFHLAEVTLVSGEQITGSFEWTFDPEDFEGGSGLFTSLDIPYTTYSLAAGNLTINIQTDHIEISGNGDIHDEGLDISIFLLGPFATAQSVSIDTELSFFECCGNGFQDQPFSWGAVSPFCIGDVANDVLADSKEHFFWQPVPGATTYYAYRGELQTLYDHVCVAASATPEYSPDEPLIPGEALYFLFSAAADCGEGGLGPGRPSGVICAP